MAGNKLLVRIGSSLMTLVFLILLSFVMVVEYVEDLADAYAAEMVKVPQPGTTAEDKDSLENLRGLVRGAYLDSVARLPLVHVTGLKKVYNYQFCHSHSFTSKSLRGGEMTISLQISGADVVRKLAGNNNDTTFNRALSHAQLRQTQTPGSFVDYFKQEYEKLNPDGILAGIFYLQEAYNGKITPASSNDEVIKIVQHDFDAANKNIFDVVLSRLSGVVGGAGNITATIENGDIHIHLKGVSDSRQVLKLLSQQGDFGFWNTYENSEVISNLADANSILKDLIVKDTAIARFIRGQVAPPPPPRSTILLDSDNVAGADNSDYQPVIEPVDTAVVSNPLFNVLYPNIYTEGETQRVGEGPIIGRALAKDTAKINRMLGLKQVKAVFPGNLKLMWGAHAFPSGAPILGLYAIKSDRPGDVAFISGDVIIDAYASVGQLGMSQVDISMNPMGAGNWEHMTESAAGASVNGKTVNKCIAIVMDNKVFSAPRVMSKITGGRSQITGIEDMYEAENLASILKSGRLVAPVKLVNYHFMPPALAIHSGHLIGLLLLALAMLFVLGIVFYRTS